MVDISSHNLPSYLIFYHLIVCMGELITNEEIDTMINMVDVDGDGQVRL